MKKPVILLILSFIILISLLTASSYIHVSGNTFTMPSDNEENNSYHTYNIDNNNKNSYNNKSYNKNYNNISNTNPPIKNNNPATSSYNNRNNYNNNNSSKYSSATDNPENTKTNKKSNINKYNKNKPNNNTKKNKQTPPPMPVNTTTPARKKQIEKTKKNNITKIEFKKHFIKIPEKTSENILFTTTPEKTSGLNFIYKSNNTSIAVFKNKKLTGIKKGFTTILIMLPDGTVQSACPVKVI